MERCNAIERQMYTRVHVMGAVASRTVEGGGVSYAWGMPCHLIMLTICATYVTFDPYEKAIICTLKSHVRRSLNF